MNPYHKQVIRIAPFTLHVRVVITVGPFAKRTIKGTANRTNVGTDC